MRKSQLHGIVITINSTNSAAPDAHFGNQCLTSDVMLEAKLIENSERIKRIKNYKPKKDNKSIAKVGKGIRALYEGIY